MNVPRHVSASAIERFVRCPANWIITYDYSLKVSTRNERSDVGTLVHAALEMFRDPANGYDQSSYDQLEACFKDVCEAHVYGESLGMYKRAKELLAAAFRMGQVHPTIPIHLAQTLRVEQPLAEGEAETWKMLHWPLPVKGFIDRVAIIPLKFMSWQKYILFIEDYKTGWVKTHEEVIDDIQAPLYFLWARMVLVPHLEAQGIEIAKIVGSWTYVAHGSAVPLYETDFDHEATEEYVASITHQMLSLVGEYNNEMRRGVPLDDFLVKYEKDNSYCGYCPRKNRCQTYTRMLAYDRRIELTGDVDWQEIWDAREAYRKIQTNAEDRVKEINDVIRVYIEQERISSIPLPDRGQEIVANRQQKKKWRNHALAELFGPDFIVKNAEISEIKINRELALLAQSNPQRAKEIEAGLATAYSTVPGAAPVKIRKIRGER